MSIDNKQMKLLLPAATTQRRPRKPSTPRLQDKRHVERLPGIDQVLGTRDIERITGRHRCTIYRWVRAGTFPSKRAGGGKGWVRSDVERWLDGGGSIAAP
ncbi:MAG: AlpA family phage regulatory protein [Steroidobacteraceae bacterium]